MDTNNSQEECLITNNTKEEYIYFEITYKLNKNKTKIFSDDFISINNDKCKIIYKNKEYELKEYFEDIDNNFINKEDISIILKINKNINNISKMFWGCETLLSIIDISNFILDDINEEGDLSYDNIQITENNLYKVLEDSQLLSALSAITNKYTTNYLLTYNINNEDNSLTSSEYNNFNNISDMSYLFWGCKSLISLPDISKWNISNVKYMNGMFSGCESLISLPDISK